MGYTAQNQGIERISLTQVPTEIGSLQSSRLLGLLPHNSGSSDVHGSLDQNQGHRPKHDQSLDDIGPNNRLQTSNAGVKDANHTNNRGYYMDIYAGGLVEGYSRHIDHYWKPKELEKIK